MVTQRITKYPVLINRILQHTHGKRLQERVAGCEGLGQEGLLEGNVIEQPLLTDPFLVAGLEEERQDLSKALGLVKELLSNVDQDVHKLEKEARLLEIYNRMDPRAQTPVPSKGPFGRDELQRRTLIHDGCLLWKTGTGRFKGQCVCWLRERGDQPAPGTSLYAAQHPGGDQWEEGNKASIAAQL